jgi:glycolate oxidase
MPLIFDAESLGAMLAVRRVFDPEERVNPGKVVPVHACREWTQGSRRRAQPRGEPVGAV